MKHPKLKTLSKIELKELAQAEPTKWALSAKVHELAKNKNLGELQKTLESAIKKEILKRVEKAIRLVEAPGQEIS